MARAKKEQFYLKKNLKYVDYYPLVRMNGTYDIAIVPTKKGTGKTFGAIREGLIGYQKNKLPFGYARATFEQLKEFAAADKYGLLLSTLGYYQAKNEKISTKGHFKIKYRSKKNTTRQMEAINYFLSINQAMNIQSSKFDKLNLLILDEIMPHFMKQSSAQFDKAINLIASVLRDHNCPIWMISNMIDENDIFIRKLGLVHELRRTRQGNIKRVIRHAKLPGGESIKLRILIYKPQEKKKFKEDLKESVAFKLSALSEYGKVINSGEFFKQLKNLKYIKRHGEFKNKININGVEFGLWTYTDQKGKVIYQFSNKLNPNGKTYYFSYLDWDQGGIMGPLDFLERTKHKFIKKEVEFSDEESFNAIVKLIQKKK